eukprot:Gb_16958 [translate_table: standard]
MGHNCLIVLLHLGTSLGIEKSLLGFMAALDAFQFHIHPDTTEVVILISYRPLQGNWLEILAHGRMRLARLHELRQAAKTEVRLHAEKEREELGLKVESRVQQAETNRMALLEVERQRRATAKERMAHSLFQRMVQEDKDKERIETLHANICQKIAAAEEKHLGFLEAEKTRAQTIVMQARKVAKSVSCQREMEMRKRKEKLEDRLQRAKKQRAEHLRQRGCRGTRHNDRHKLHKYGDCLSRKLARCWKQFQRSRRTTYALAQEYATCAISQQTVTSLPFEQLAARIQSTTTLQSVKALLDRVESRFMLSQGSHSNVSQLDHLLKHVSPGNRRTPLNGNRAAKVVSCQVSGKGVIDRERKKSEEKELQRYPSRVFLCAYMILGLPEAVFSTRGDRENALTEAATKLVQQFESLVTTILEGPACSPQSRPSLPNSSCDDWDPESPQLPYPQRPFSAQLAAFDAAWCSYLYEFVAWKVKDAQSLEEDLIRVVCQLEISMMQKCKITSEGDESALSHDTKAIHSQVLEDQKLIQEKLFHLSGTAGTARMEAALFEARSKFMEAMENGAPLPSPFFHISFSSSSSHPSQIEGKHKGTDGNSMKVACSLFNDSSQSRTCSNTSPDTNMNESGSAPETKMWNDNEVIVNDMLHDTTGTFPNTLLGIDIDSGEAAGIKAQIKSTMEKAFWDGVVESLTRNPPDYSWIIGLVKEVRDELDVLIPESWKQELNESIDLELFSQLLESGTQDIEYLGKLLNYAFGVVLKLLKPAKDNAAKDFRERLALELSEMVASMDKKSNISFAQALVKGLRFILEQIQVLKQEISAARIRALELFIQGSAGVKYLQNAFSTRYALSSAAINALPQTVEWLAQVRQTIEQERTDFEAVLMAFRSRQTNSVNTQAPRIPPVTSLQTGGRVAVSKNFPAYAGDTIVPSSAGYLGAKHLEIQWNSMENLVKLGLLLLASRPDIACEENTPETLKLNIGRLRKMHNNFERIIIIATSLLVLRQTLADKRVPAAEVNNILCSANKQLNVLLRNPVATIHHIGHVLAKLSLPFCEEDQADANEELITRVLSRSLSVEDVVFARVSAAVHSGIRTILLVGKGFEGTSLAGMALKRIGASFLIDLLVEAADALEVMAAVTCQVHGPWYTCIGSMT